MIRVYNNPVFEEYLFRVAHPSTWEKYEGQNGFILTNWNERKNCEEYMKSRSSYVWLSASTLVTVQCYNCRKLVQKPVSVLFKKHLSKYFADRFVCDGSGDGHSGPCARKMNADYNRYRASIGDAAAQGKIVTKEETAKRIATIVERYGSMGAGLKTAWRKGKTMEEIYGEETAARAKEKIRAARKNVVIEPALGHIVNAASRKKMSDRRIDYFARGADKECKHPHPEDPSILLNWGDYQRAKVAYRRSRYTTDERMQISQKIVTGILNSFKAPGRHSKVGKITYWLLPRSEYYESSYEETYFHMLNHVKAFWKKNKVVYIKYWHPQHKELRWYVPDVLIYTDEYFQTIEYVVEVKPAIFLEKQPNAYNCITRSKIAALKRYCRRNGYKSIIVTETDLKKVPSINEDNKNNSESPQNSGTYLLF